MAGNSKPLRWDAVGAKTSYALVAFMFRPGSEHIAREHMLESLGDVDERYVHVTRDDDGYGCLTIKREETDGLEAVS